MSIKTQDKVLTYEQARELKWFCKNIVGTKQEFYALFDKVEIYKEKIDRLLKEADQILKYCKDNNINLLGEEPTPQKQEGDE